MAPPWGWQQQNWVQNLTSCSAVCEIENEVLKLMLSFAYAVVQAMLCAVQVSPMAGIVRLMACYRHTATHMKTQAAPFLFKGFPGTVSLEESRWISALLKLASHHWDQLVLMWSLSLFLIISKAKLKYSYFSAFVSLNSSLLPRSCTAVWSSKPNRTCLNVAFHLILKLAVVGYWLGEYQEGSRRWTGPTSDLPLYVISIL